jgi:hypothetical protein
LANAQPGAAGLTAAKASSVTSAGCQLVSTIMVTWHTGHAALAAALGPAPCRAWPLAMSHCVFKSLLLLQQVPIAETANVWINNHRQKGNDVA